MKALLLLSLMLGCLQIGPTAQQKGSEKKNDELLPNLLLPNLLVKTNNYNMSGFGPGSIDRAMTVGINWQGNRHEYFYRHSKCYLLVYVDDGASKYLHDHKNFIQKSEGGRMVIGGAKHKIYPKCVDNPFSAGDKKIFKFFSYNTVWSMPIFNPQGGQGIPEGADNSRLYLSGKGGELTILMALIYFDDKNSFEQDGDSIQGGESCRLTADAGGNIKDLKCERRSVPRKYYSSTG